VNTLLEAGTADVTPSCYITIDYAMARRHRAFLIRKAVFGSLLGLYIASVTSYFALGFFQVGATVIHGNVNFTSDDYFSLCGTSTNTSLLFFDGETAAKNAVASSQGFLRSAVGNSDAFQSSVTFVEDYPVGMIAGTPYFSSGKTWADMSEKINQLPLSDVSKDAFRTALSAENDRTDLPAVHYPNMTVKDPVEAMKNLVGLRYDVLTYLEGIQYRNNSQDSNWSDVVDAVVYDKKTDSRFLFSNFASDILDKVFREETFFTDLLPNCEKVAAEKRLTLVNYSYLDGTGATYTDLPVVYPYYNSKTDRVILSIQPASA
jgi:hypothetical protein